MNKRCKKAPLFTPFFDELNSITFITKKASQARYNLTRFADSDVPRHSNLLTQVSQVVKLAERKRLFEGYQSSEGRMPTQARLRSK